MRDWIFISSVPRKPRMADIAALVAIRHGVSVEQMKSPNRERKIFYARREAMARIYDAECFSYPQIGRFFNRDHSSVYYAVESFRALAKQEAA